MSIEVDLDERELGLILDGLFAIIAHPTTTREDWHDASELSDFLLALGAGHFDGWGEAEKSFVQQGMSAREEIDLTSPPTLRLVESDKTDW